MKIGVLTFHRCINYGSYWQARCMVGGLRAQGHDAVLLDHDDPGIRWAEWKCAFQPQLPVRSGRDNLIRYRTKTRRFLAAFDELPQSPRFALDRPQDAGHYDAVLIGSDEVWNFRHPWYGGKPIFFGEGLDADRVASYAASFGNHDADEGIGPEWAARLARLDAISVRDENSRRLVREALGCEPALVLDPCLQFPPPDVVPADLGAPYLAVYGHGFDSWFETAIRAHADARGLRVVSIGYRCDWADAEEIEADPERFSALIAGATAVATNFFHGCVFALHHQRPFACAPSSYRFNKVRDLTRALGAERHLVTWETPAEALAERLEAPLDPAIHATIAELRANSNRYLDAVLG